MKIIGFNFSKINVEKMKRTSENLKIGTEIDIFEVKLVNSGILKTNEEVFEARFKYNVNYEPSYAKIQLEGHILFSVDPKIAKELLTMWKKKEMPENIKFVLLNVVMKKAGPKAISLEDELNLPLHIPFPVFRKDQEAKK